MEQSQEAAKLLNVRQRLMGFQLSRLVKGVSLATFGQCFSGKRFSRDGRGHLFAVKVQSHLDLCSTHCQ
jgi:hypothetical protein